MSCRSLDFEPQVLPSQDRNARTLRQHLNAKDFLTPELPLPILLMEDHDRIDDVVSEASFGLADGFRLDTCDRELVVMHN